MREPLGYRMSCRRCEHLIELFHFGGDILLMRKFRSRFGTFSATASEFLGKLSKALQLLYSSVITKTFYALCSLLTLEYKGWEATEGLEGYKQEALIDRFLSIRGISCLFQTLSSFSRFLRSERSNNQYNMCQFSDSRALDHGLLVSPIFS